MDVSQSSAGRPRRLESFPEIATFRGANPGWLGSRLRDPGAPAVGRPRGLEAESPATPWPSPDISHPSLNTQLAVVDSMIQPHWPDWPGRRQSTTSAAIAGVARRRTAGFPGRLGPMFRRGWTIVGWLGVWA